MVKVPEPLRCIFDTFPLQTYSEVLHESQSSHSNEFFFDSKNSSHVIEKSGRKFCLAVHKAQLIKLNGVMKRVPTDPFGLANSLILCYRHELKLPSEEKGLKSQHSIKLMSYLASPDNELPMLVENRSSVTEVITSSKAFQKSIASKYFLDDAQGFMFNQLLDNLKDLWIFILLSDIPRCGDADYSGIFHQDWEISSSNIANYLMSLKLATIIPNWTSFRTRYPHLFHSSATKPQDASRLTSESLLEVLATSDPKAMEVMYFEKLQDFERLLPLIMRYLNTTQQSDDKVIIELKLASFVFAVSNFIPESTYIGRAFKSKYQHIVQQSYEVLERF